MDTRPVKYVGRRAAYPHAQEVRLGEWNSLTEAQRALAPGGLWCPAYESLQGQVVLSGPLAPHRLLRPTRWYLYGDDDSVLIIDVQSGHAAPPALRA